MSILRRLLTASVTCLSVMGCDPDSPTEASLEESTRADDTMADPTTGTDPDDPTDGPGEIGLPELLASAVVAFHAAHGVEADTDGIVSAWTDAAQGVRAVETGADLGGISLTDDDGVEALFFDGATPLFATLPGADRLTDATILVRFRYDPVESDNDYLYALGVEKENGTPGSLMSLSRGDFNSQGVDESYHYNGADPLYGNPIPNGQWITSTQTFHGAPQPEGESHHTLLLDGVDAQVGTAEAQYSAAAELTIGNYTSGNFRLERGRIRGLVIFDRLLEPSEMGVVEDWLLDPTTP